VKPPKPRSGHTANTPMPSAPDWATVIFDDEDLRRWSNTVGEVPADLGIVSGDTPVPVEVVQFASGLINDPVQVESPMIRVGEAHLNPGAAVRLARLLNDAVALLNASHPT
jgi:hypothetical protein